MSDQNELGLSSLSLLCLFHGEGGGSSTFGLKQGSGYEPCTPQARQQPRAAHAQRVGNNMRYSLVSHRHSNGSDGRTDAVPGIAPDLISLGFVSLGTALH